MKCLERGMEGEKVSSEGTLSLFQRKVSSEMSVSTVRVEEPLYLMCDTTSYDLDL